ncbi:30S ribosomal protein S20 [Candidatus Nomurabacteria bacterium]|nr:30S ribosomal protein S20 [Candidatus Nomurabacteria bacterium]MCB9820479.1 30S ribosomal protein S20 [Candidatus Nomurabacteria bacterium]
MPIKDSAKKSLRVSKRKKLVNDRRKKTLRDTSKKVEKDIKADKKIAAQSLSAAYKAIDKAAKRGIIKKNTASRKKSKLARMVNKA